MSERLSEDLEKELNSRNRFTKALRVIMYAGLVESLTELEQVIIYHSTLAGEMAALTMGSTLLLTKFIEYSKTEGKKLNQYYKAQKREKIMMNMMKNLKDLSLHMTENYLKTL